MSKPSLVILAAGMGSRYGGLKQIDPVDEYGNILIDYSIYDALKAGFEHIVCIIKKEIEQDFFDVIGRRIEKLAKVSYAYQELDKLPKGYSLPDGRVKPWGTAHALLCTKGLIDGPFAVINSDDYYGPSAFVSIYDYLSGNSSDFHDFAMVGYAVENTLSANGEVTRAVCIGDDKGCLSSVVEVSGIRQSPEGGVYELDGESVIIPRGTTVSMNLWGFTQGIYPMLESGFVRFLDEELTQNPLKCEYLLPTAVEDFILNGGARVHMLKSADQWFGVTYRDDMPKVKAAMRKLKQAGVYSERLWR